ncbi:MAG: hypothetical protein JW941_01120 [Candidatus Coatesbacteria bacterium]|nr:hypothetical protein [Candidatus Coatesbacteria bacterium]
MRGDIASLLRARWRSHLGAQPEQLFYTYGSPSGADGARLDLCPGKELPEGCLSSGRTNISTAVYDIVILTFRQPDSLPTNKAYLEWYGEDEARILGRLEAEIEKDSAVFFLKPNLNWLELGEVSLLRVGLVHDDISPHLGSMSIRQYRPIADSSG